MEPKGPDTCRLYCGGLFHDVAVGVLKERIEGPVLVLFDLSVKRVIVALRALQPSPESVQFSEL